MSPEWSKIIVIFSLGFSTLIVGIVPAAFTNYNLRRNALLFTFLLCFGAGVLLATSIVHMLPEVSEDLGHGLAEIIFCLGFLFVYLIDELLHFCCGEAIQHSHGSTDEESQLILPPQGPSGNAHSYGSTERTPSKKNETCEEHQHQHDVQDEIVNERICHTSHTEPCRQTLAGIIGLLTALTIHALIEGLAIGIQDTSPKVMILFTAVISHKLVVGFCLGVELSVTAGATFKNHFVAIFVFSFGSVLGIAVGMGLVDLNSVLDSKFLPVIQGLAGGTLLYVTVCEVLPRERARWHGNQETKSAGLLQFTACTLGFAVMTILNTYIKEDE